MIHDFKIHENNSLTSIEDPDRSKTLEVTSSPSAGRKRNNSSSSTISSASDKTGPFAATHNENTSFIKLLESLRIIVNSQTVPKKSSSIPKPHLFVSLQQDANSILDQLETKAKHLQSNNKQTNPPQKSRSIGQQTETALSTSSNSPASQQITPAPPSLQRKSPNPSTTYAEVTKKHQASKKSPTLLLYPMKSAEKEEVLEILKREIAWPSTKIKDVQKIKNKGVAMQLGRDQDVEELIQTINSKETLKSIIETKKPGKRHPSIIIYNLRDETTEDEVQEALAINAAIKERLNIRFKLSGRTPGLLAEAVLVTIPLESADHLRRSALIVLCTTNSTEQGSDVWSITTHPTAAAPATWESSIQSNSNKNQTSHNIQQFRLQKNSNLKWSTSSTTTTAIYIIQINLDKSKVATAHLEKLASQININHFLAQEPYVKEDKFAGVPRKWHQWLSSNNKARIISLPSTNNPIFICSTTNLTAIKIQTITGPANLISSYFSPYAELQDTAQDLANLLTKIGPEKALIGADMNAPSTLWGYANNSPSGNIMEDLISGLNLHLLNEKNSEPTFQRRNAKGWPDLTLVKGVQLARTASWKVRDELSSSDHKYIHTQLGISVQNHTYTRFKTAYGGHRKFSMHFRKEIPQIQQQY
ncbi:hypothetical protein AVEN_177310-1 [Araneus ventricosus]|uniref:Endonuclease/exonuclease/phosphatase domain-containing protein n=1 Tax=Araneus ventricosus TaxID=182803 RepID=A0A4Y2C663_ARAVE|nr:hypothetical protein AVEN_177310-1 [Araneus ventricosus]